VADEIERKFLLADASWRQQVSTSCDMRQGYIIGSDKASVRIRVSGRHGHINIKSAKLGIVRKEYEIEIDVNDAHEMLDNLCQKPLIEKTRHIVNTARHRWEIDEFRGENLGLIVAEIELSAVDEQFDRPPWLGEEVSHDPRYYNVSLVKHPFKDW